MSGRFPTATMAALLLAACLAGLPLCPAAAQDAAPGKATVLAGLYGRALGAASECPDAVPPRLGAATEKASARVKAMSRDENEVAVASRRLTEGIDGGRRAVLNGVTTCGQAMAELHNLEHDLAQPIQVQEPPR